MTNRTQTLSTHAVCAAVAVAVAAAFFSVYLWFTDTLRLFYFSVFFLCVCCICYVALCIYKYTVVLYGQQAMLSTGTMGKRKLYSPFLFLFSHQ